jgi:hypothetical protein
MPSDAEWDAMFAAMSRRSIGGTSNASDTLSAPEFRRPENPDAHGDPGALLDQHQHQRKDQHQRENDRTEDVETQTLGDSTSVGVSTKTAEKRKSEEPQIRTLVRLHRQGKWDPEPIAGLGPLPANPTRAMRALRGLLELRFGLLLADGTDVPMMLATSELVAEGIVTTKAGASWLLHRFEELGIIWSPGEMPALGKGNGTRTFLPGSKPEGPEPVSGWRVLPASDAVGDLEPRAVSVEDATFEPVEVDVQEGGVRLADVAPAIAGHPGTVASGDGAEQGQLGVHEPDDTPQVGSQCAIFDDF